MVHEVQMQKTWTQITEIGESKKTIAIKNSGCDSARTSCGVSRWEFRFLPPCAWITPAQIEIRHKRFFDARPTPSDKARIERPPNSIHGLV